MDSIGAIVMFVADLNPGGGGGSLYPHTCVVRNMDRYVKMHERIYKRHGTSPLPGYCLAEYG